MAEQADLKLRVFISSTFRDVHTERDVLTRDVFPRLAAELNAHGVHLYPIDLRWGVTAADSASGNALKICLDEIDRSDIFLCILGTRYGWRPKEYLVIPEGHDWIEQHKEKSITEMEIRRACLNNEKTRNLKIKDAVFLFRGDSFINDIPVKSRPVFVDGHVEHIEPQETSCEDLQIEEVSDGDKLKEDKLKKVSDGDKLKFVPDEEAQEMLDSLKEEIQEAYELQDIPGLSIEMDTYDPTFVGVKDALVVGANDKLTLGNMNSFAESCYTMLKKCCQKFLPKKEAAVKSVSPGEMHKEYANLVSELENLAHHRYMALHSSNFVGRQDLVSSCIRYFKSTTCDGPLVLESSSGSGATAIMSKIAMELINDSNNHYFEIFGQNFRVSTMDNTKSETKQDFELPKPRRMNRRKNIALLDISRKTLLKDLEKKHQKQLQDSRKAHINLESYTKEDMDKEEETILDALERELSQTSIEGHSTVDQMSKESSKDIVSSKSSKKALESTKLSCTEMDIFATHFAGATPFSVRMNVVLRHLTRQMHEQLLAYTNQIPIKDVNANSLDEEELNNFRYAVKQCLAATTGNVCILIDNLCGFEGFGSERLPWLFSSHEDEWGKRENKQRLRIMIQMSKTSDNFPKMKKSLNSRQGIIEPLTVGGLNRRDQTLMIMTLLDNYGKKLDEEQLGVLMSKQESNRSKESKVEYYLRIENIHKRCRK